MKVKLGAIYNIWDAEEHLEESVESVKKTVHEFFAVYQNTSNYGQASDIDLKSFLIAKGISNLSLYTPNLFLSALENELHKRNLGIDAIRRTDCTHFIMLDCDEIYKPEEFAKAFEIFLIGEYDSSACQMLSFYKDKQHILEPPEDYFVSLFYKLDERRLTLGSPWPISVDPTRRLRVGKLKIFTREEIQMLHYSFIRKDIRKKIFNSSAFVNHRSQAEKICEYYENWQDGQQAMWWSQMWNLRRV